MGATRRNGSLQIQKKLPSDREGQLLFATKKKKQKTKEGELSSAVGTSMNKYELEDGTKMNTWQDGHIFHTPTLPTPSSPKLKIYFFFPKKEVKK